MLPSISIVVPNYNGGATLEATLQSLIGQEYPGLEILVVDGGSSDGSLEIIRRYEKHLAWWVSEKDRGQSHAINKGFAHAQGEIINWLCSDDLLLPGALTVVGNLFAARSDIDIVAGATVARFTDGRKPEYVWKPSRKLIELLPITAPFGQPSCFFKQALFSGRSFFIDESYSYALDTELWTYFRFRKARWLTIDTPLSCAVQSTENKTSTGAEKITHELERLYNSYIHERIPLTYWHRRLRYPLERIRHRRRGRLFAYLVYFPYQCAVIALLSPFYGFKRVRWMNWVDFG